MTRRSDAGEARNRGPLVSSSQCLNTKCGQSKRFGTGPGRVRVQAFWPNTQLPPIGIRAKIWAYTWVSEKFGHSNAKTQKTGHSNTFFIKKRGFIPGGAEKWGRGDRGKMIHFFKIFFFCFYDWIYLIAFKCIIHCQVLATTLEKEKQA